MKGQIKNLKIKTAIALGAVVGICLIGTSTTQASVFTPKTERVSRVGYQAERVDRVSSEFQPERVDRVSEKGFNVFLPTELSNSQQSPIPTPEPEVDNLRPGCWWQCDSSGDPVCIVICICGASLCSGDM